MKNCKCAQSIIVYLVYNTNCTVNASTVFPLFPLLDMANQQLRKKVIILAGRGSGAIGAIDIYPTLKEKYGDRFVFLDYCHEKELVDGWFLENEKVLDPMFDIMISESSVDKRKVFGYIATNHLYKLREYNKLFPEEVAKWLTNEERRELYL